MSFRRSAVSLGVEIVGETAFGDHHDYNDGDVRRVCADAQAAGADIVLTTEKDAGKLQPLVAPDQSWWTLRIQAEVVRGEERLRRLVLGKGEACA